MTHKSTFALDPAYRPLQGKTIVVTRAREQASSLVNIFSQRGANVIQCPTIRIEPPENYDALDAALANFDKYNWIIFTSVNGVTYFFNFINNRDYDARLLATAKIAAIGPATNEALKEHGLRADLIPTKSISESVADNMIRHHASGKVLLVRAAQGRTVLQEKLTEAGMQVDIAPCYQTVPDDSNAEDVRKLLQNGDVDWITFTSSSTVINFIKAVGAENIQTAQNTFKIACIGPITAKTAQENGLIIDVMTSGSSTRELAEAICKATSSHLR